MERTLWMLEVHQYRGKELIQCDTEYLGFDKDAAMKEAVYKKNHLTEKEAARCEFWLLGWKTDKEGDPKEILDELWYEDGRLDPNEAERV